jgi:hypothetical protein
MYHRGGRCLQQHDGPAGVGEDLAVDFHDDVPVGRHAPYRVERLSRVTPDLLSLLERARERLPVEFGVVGKLRLSGTNAAPGNVPSWVSMSYAVPLVECTANPCRGLRTGGRERSSGVTACGFTREPAMSAIGTAYAETIRRGSQTRRAAVESTTVVPSRSARIRRATGCWRSSRIAVAITDDICSDMGTRISNAAFSTT